jgi:hypothetical protein
LKPLPCCKMKLDCFPGVASRKGLMIFADASLRTIVVFLGFLWPRLLKPLSFPPLVMG